MRTTGEDNGSRVMPQGSVGMRLVEMNRVAPNYSETQSSNAVWKGF